MEKKCFKCGIVKDLSEFYKHKQMGDGHLNKCKECTRKDCYLAYEEKRKDPGFVESEKERAKEKYHRLNYKDRQRNSNRPYKKDWRFRNIHRNNKLHKNECAHHWNYNLPKDFIVLSEPMHRKIHRFINLDLDTLVFTTIKNEILDTKEKHLAYIERVKNNEYKKY